MKRSSLYLGLILVVGAAACTTEEAGDSNSDALDTADGSDRPVAYDDGSDDKPILCTNNADVCPDGTFCDPLACEPSCPGCEDCNPACVPDTPILCDPNADGTAVADQCPKGTFCDPNACAPSCPACDDCNPACVPVEPQPCCSLDDKPGENGNPICFEGASCCGDGSWQCNAGNGQSTCDSPGEVCEKEACCSIEDMPGFNGNPFCFEGATCCGDGTWQCNQGNGEPTCDVTGDMCPVDECGGFGGIECPYGQVCVDYPLDNCDPNNGGADCGGVCIDDPSCGDDPDVASYQLANP